MQRGVRPLHDDVMTERNKYGVMQRGVRPLLDDVSSLLLLEGLARL
jgi:hypothetical protein